MSFKIDKIFFESFKMFFNNKKTIVILRAGLLISTNKKMTNSIDISYIIQTLNLEVKCFYNI